MTVRAKFRCDSITETQYNKEVKFSAIYGKEGENADFTKATPWGNLTMGMDKDSPAAEQFSPGKEYYLTFEEAPATN